MIARKITDLELPGTWQTTSMSRHRLHPLQPTIRKLHICALLWLGRLMSLMCLALIHPSWSKGRLTNGVRVRVFGVNFASLLVTVTL